MISEHEFAALVPGSIVTIHDAFTLGAPERATVVRRDTDGTLAVRVHSRNPDGQGWGSGYTSRSIVTVEFDMSLVTDFLRNAKTCHNCASCAAAADSILAYVETMGGK